MPQYRKIPYDSDCHSNVTQTGERVICVATDELVECGVSYVYLRKALERHRNGKLTCWSHHKESRSVFLHFDGLKDKYKRLIEEKFCGGSDITTWLENEETRKREVAARGLVGGLADSLSVSEEVVEYFKGLELYTGTQCQQLARSAAWLTLINGFTAKYAHSNGYKSVVEVRVAALNEIQAETKNNLIIGLSVNSERFLTKQAKQFAREGIESLVDKRKFTNKKNAEKIPEGGKGWLIAEYSKCSPKISVVDLSAKYNTEMVEAYGWKKVTVGSIEKFLSHPQYKALWFKPRHGRAAEIKHIMPQAVREKVGTPDAIWSIDGTPIQRYYRDDKGKMKSGIYAYFVVDGCSGAVVGHAFGCTENSQLVTDALMNAMANQKRKPYQLQYDQGSVHMSDAVSSLFDNMTNIHFPCKPYLARPKWVERSFADFQQQQQATKADFKGSNVTSNGLDQKANPDSFKGKDKRNSLLTLEELLNDLDLSVAAYNTTGTKRDKHGVRYGDTPMDKYNADYKDKQVLTDYEISSLFVVELSKPYKYKQAGILKIIDGEKHYFIVPDHGGNGSTDFNFQSLWLDKEFTVRVSLTGFNTYMKLYKSGKYIATAFNRVKLSPTIKDYQNGNGASPAEFKIGMKEWEEHNKKRREEMLQIGEEYALAPTGTTGAIGFENMRKDDFNKFESDVSDKLNGVTEHNSILERLKERYK